MNAIDVARLRQAEGYLELGLGDAAWRTLQGLTGAAREQPACLFLTAECHRAAGRFGQAIPLLERLLAEHSGRPDIHVQLAWCYKRTDQLPRAIRTLETAERLCRSATAGRVTHALVQYNLACYHALTGAADDCRRWLRKAFALEPKFAAHVADESDFDPVRDRPEFRELVNRTLQQPTKDR